MTGVQTCALPILAPHKKQVDFAQVEATLAFFEQCKAEGRLQPLRPDTYTLMRNDDQMTLAERPPLF